MLICGLHITHSELAFAGPRDALLNGLSDAAKATSGRFDGFSAERGRLLHEQRFTGGKPDTPSCTTCHSADPQRAGKSPTGKPIEPLALSVSPQRYSDAAKVEKWFRRNCLEVMGRECTSLEKGDWLAYMLSR